VFTSEIPATVPNFWSPVSQIVPVLALTLVIEARRLLGTWRNSPAVMRLFLSFAVLFTGVVLWQVQWWALTAMARGESDPALVNLAQLAIGSVVAVLALQPLANLFVNGNIGIWTVAWRVWPWSRWARTKRGLKRLVRRARAELVGSQKLLADAQLLVDEARSDQKNFTAMTELGRTIIAAAEQSNVPETVIDEGRTLLETGALLREGDGQRMKEILDVRRQAKRAVRRVKRLLAEVEQLESDMKLGRMTEQERRDADSIIDEYLMRTDDSVRSR
jgi:hypothetical protein